mgnify:CR=1 FL=1
MLLFGKDKPAKAHTKVDERLTHIAFIMDGNGRWAKKRSMPREYGHVNGAKTFKKIIRYCGDIGVKMITVYAFSTENWKRPLEEVNAIMRLFGEYLLKGFDYKNRNIRIKFMGDRTVLDDVLDRFGTDIQIFERDEQTFTAVLTTPPRGVRFWALQYLSFVEVVEPAWLRQEIIESIGQNWYSTGER